MPTPSGLIVLSSFDALTHSGLFTHDKKQRIMKHNKITGSPSTYLPTLVVQVADMDSIAKQFHLILTEALLKTPAIAILRAQPPRQSQNHFCRARRYGRIALVKDAPNGEPGSNKMVRKTRWMIVIPYQLAAINGEAGVNSSGNVGVITVATEGEIDKWTRLELTGSLASGKLVIIRKSFL